MKTVVEGCQTRPEESKIEAEGWEWGRGSWGGGSKPPPHQLGVLGSAVSSSSGVHGEAPIDHPKFSTIFSTQDGLSWHYIIVNCGSQKMKNSYPIQSWVNYCALGDAVWCFVVYETKCTVRKSQEVVFTAGKRSGRWGGDYTLGCNSPRDV